MEEWNIGNLDCDKMLINPRSPKLVSFLEKNIPSIKNHKVEYAQEVFTKTMVYRYIVLLYDENSDINRMQSLDWAGKKYEACGYAGFKLKKGKDGKPKFDKRVYDMVSGKNDGVNEIIIDFLGWQSKPKWNYEVFIHESILGLVREALKGNRTDIRTSKEYRALYEDFYRLSNEIGHVYDETEEFASKFYYKIEQARLSVRPEDYAKALSEGDDLRVDNPYGVNYNVD